MVKNHFQVSEQIVTTTRPFLKDLEMTNKELLDKIREEILHLKMKELQRTNGVNTGADVYLSSYAVLSILSNALTEESEDERIRKWLVDYFGSIKETVWIHRDITCGQILSWLEKQKEQKPASSEDMPYVADEHFFEREPADTFKYRLAEYMTKNCTGHSFNISSESILQMAKEELIKRGELQKPVEWSEEDEKRIKQLIYDTEHIKAGYEKKKEQLGERFNDALIKDCDEQIAWLKSLRPPKDCSNDCPKHLQGYIDGRGDVEKKLLNEYGILIMPEGELHMKARWKPSEEQMRCFDIALALSDETMDENLHNVLVQLREQLKRLM